MHLCGGERRSAFSDSIRSSVQLSRIKVRKTLERKVWIITARRDSGLGLLSVAQAQDPEVEATRIMSAALTFHLNSFARWLTGEQRQRIFMFSRTHPLRHYPHSAVRQRAAVTHARTSTEWTLKWQNTVNLDLKPWIGSFRPAARRVRSLIAKGLTTWDFCPATPSDRIRSASYFYWPP